MTARDLARLVYAARCDMEALADRLRAVAAGRAADAAIETDAAEESLRALEAAWARALPALPEGVTPPGWPFRGNKTRLAPTALARLLGSWASLEYGERLDVADGLDAYADGLRAWGREAARCLEEEEV